MKLSQSKIDALCRAQGRTVSQLLDESRVSRNSYYSLARKEVVVPRSVMKLAEALDVPVSALLDDILPVGDRIRQRRRAVESIIADHPDLDRDNVRHTLTLLDEDPLTRIRRALRRGRARILR
jgi:transcriptional regulator with XRE-family HTH domain